MTIRVKRIVFTAVAAEVLAVLMLIILVTLFGPSDADAAQAYAERLGYWVGPISGFALCLLGGLWVARGLHAAHVLNGLRIHRLRILRLRLRQIVRRKLPHAGRKS